MLQHSAFFGVLPDNAVVISIIYGKDNHIILIDFTKARISYLYFFSFNNSTVLVAKQLNLLGYLSFHKRQSLNL
ncbi:hypothetical protein KL86DYS2_10138 [uncultured Dysgonomonas sp.]|uniref:Uncharacterized protein n=1 Tax=uncultured Dysgonomonas sp. TaxID=206096 RepID=A0A212IVE7_9BACT|nr:hypothetical protein KL86DYS2_10138 [uncultured Dysgonomonas sp.]